MFHITFKTRILCTNKTKEEALANWIRYGAQLKNVNGTNGFELREGDTVLQPLV